ncbi:hypothetical protein BC939DRAFT_478258 [Gamsiella multidivaricata]|uniref:uncharacterized protein n=1 Tax=Gamsiella multidivaricata TaxID=101098 RepID=UPI00221F4799|nr:uncharacterized protein BC939DRAFT_478258 [Gamsiella multidivaricata]KAG0367975.1 hypothetical protein BGZ54_002920 [Gamsiella multidivaricata]KAI7821544.1 hypothetical protein BC939DRAFT_478258 [Gamsiella multidivaricata]
MIKLESAQNEAPADRLETKGFVGSPVAIIDGVSFSADAWSNWGQNLSSQPEATFYPHSLKDLMVIVREAKNNDKKIRCAGTGHSWCSSSATSDYLVLNHNLNKIYSPKEGQEGWTVTIESGVTVAELDQALRQHNPPLALPSNVVPSTVRYGGVLSMGCHGVSLNSRTMSDMISEMTILNANNELVTYSEQKDPEAFSAACLNLGLLGIIYTATLRVEVMHTRLLVRDSYPTLESVFEGPDAGLRVKAMILKNDSTEFLYWPFKHFMKPDQNDAIWIKEWERTTAPAEPVDPYKDQPPTVDNPFFSMLHVGERVLEIPEALHFQLGDEVTTVLDAGVAFKADMDFKNVVECWKELIAKNWVFTTSMPERMGTALEMRMIKSSNKLLSPLYDEDPEAIYCMINVIAASGTPGFEEYSAGIVTDWIEKYNAKPHWPKMWESVPNIVPYLRREYGDRLVRFNHIRKLQDPSDVFVNGTWKPLLQDL